MEGVATFTAKYVNQPAQGRKNGTVKTEDNSIYVVDPSLLSKFAVGGTYEVQYSTYDFKGTTFRKVASVKQTATPQAQPSGGGGYRTDDVTAERIFVCGALNAAIHSGHLDVSSDLVPLINKLRNDWAQTFGGKTGAQRVAAQQRTVQYDPEMNDEIPF